MKLVLVLSVLLSVPSAFAATQKAPRTPSTADQTFVDNLARGNAAEIAAGRMCMERCTSPAAKAFGKMMVTDHTGAGDTFSALVQRKRMTLPVLESPTAVEKDLMENDPASFDQDYLTRMVSEHTKVAALLAKEIKDGKDADLKKFAKELLPVVNHHKSEAQRISELLKYPESK